MNQFLKFIEKNKLKSILIAIPLVPIIINYFLLTWHFPGVQNEDWLGFLSNYSGGIIGGIVAFIVANHQVKIQMEEQIKNEEEVKYINQLPTLINVTFELKKMKESIKNAYLMRNELERIYKQEIQNQTFNLDKVKYQIELLNIENWSTVKDIQDVDLQKSLFELKNNYNEMSYALNYDFDEVDIQIESMNAFDVEHYLKLNKIVTENNFISSKKEWAWEELMSKDYIVVLDDMLKITDLMIKSIDELMEKRHLIRDKN